MDSVGVPSLWPLQDSRRRNNYVYHKFNISHPDVYLDK